MTQPQADFDAPFLQIYRAGLKNAAELMIESGNSVAELSRARSLDELLALQSRLATVQFERSVSLWSDWLSWVSETYTPAPGETGGAGGEGR